MGEPAHLKRLQIALQWSSGAARQEIARQIEELAKETRPSWRTWCLSCGNSIPKDAIGEYCSSKCEKEDREFLAAEAKSKRKEARKLKSLANSNVGG